jgi:hypothetical protein
MWLLLVGIVVIALIVIVAMIVGGAGMVRQAPDPSEGNKDVG